MLGIEFLWGESVQLETWEASISSETPQSTGNFWDPAIPTSEKAEDPVLVEWKPVLYTMKNRKLQKKEI